MKLSSKIDFILLPVMIVIFSTAGFISYNSQKAQLKSALSDKIHNHLEYISHDMDEALHELDSITRMMLESHYIQKHINNLNNKKEQYYLEKELIFYINQLEIHHGNIESFAIIDEKGNDLIYFHNNDPFSQFTINETVQQHLNRNKVALSKNGIALLDTTTYQLTEVNDVQLFSVIKSFSPEQSLTVPTFSSGHTIYTAVILSRIEHKQEFAERIKTKISENAVFSVTPNTSSVSLKSDSQIKDITVPNFEFGFELDHPLWKIKICLAKDTLVQQFLLPFKLLFTTIVLLVTSITFILLKWLINIQLIKPISLLKKQVETANTDGLINIERSKNDDEVSVLTNMYIDLISDLDDLAKRDPLTGLPNRTKFNIDIERIKHNAVQHNHKCGVIYFDLDHFKQVNDKYGHHTGDKLLSGFAKIFVDSFVDINWEKLQVTEFEFARLSGDEFAMIVGGFDDSNVLTTFCQRILSIFSGGLRVDNTTYDIGVSIGISVFPDDSKNEIELVNNADFAMYSAKKDHHNSYRFYSEQLNNEAKRQEWINECIKASLRTEQFFLNFMPIYSTRTGKICGAEVLLRTTNTDLAAFGPADFIPIAEKSSLIKDIDYWVVKTAIIKLSEWIRDVDFDGVLAINFSSWHLMSIEFVQYLSSLIEEYNIPPHYLEMEITETCFVPGDDKNIDMLKSLRKLGVRISLDDFGTGYTAFGQLIKYPIDTIKIDRIFTNAINTESKTKQLIDVIIDMARVYNLNVIAEGIETEKQFEYIKKIGCHQGQGFFMSKPIPEHEFLTLWMHDK